MTTFSRVRWYWLAVASTGGLAACGGGGDNALSTSPAPSPTPSASITALDCLPTAQMVAGYTNTLTKDVTEVTITGGVSAAPQVSSYTETNTIIGTTIIDGVTVSASRNTDTRSPGDSITSYERISGTQYLGYGWDQLSTIPSTPSTSTTRYSSPDVVDFGLAAGQAQPYAYTQTTTSTSFPIDTPERDSISGSKTFVGLESVVTPLGTFTSACKFTVTMTAVTTSETVTATQTLWVSRSSGLPIKQELSETRSGSPGVVSSSTEVLSAGSINGSAIVAQ